MVVAPSASTSTCITSTAKNPAPALETPPGEEAPPPAPEVEGPLEATGLVVALDLAGPGAPGLVALGVLPLAGFGGGGSGPGARPGPGAGERGGKTLENRPKHPDWVLPGKLVSHPLGRDPSYGPLMSLELWLIANV